MDYTISEEKNILQDVAVLNKFSIGNDHGVRVKTRINVREEETKMLINCSGIMRNYTKDKDAYER